ncbi:MAG: AAA family ATPase [Gammaproteobacteria bacterium]
MLTELTFRRAHLAQAYCDSLQGKGIANATSGLFLAGPRRVGKSTFLINDLIPEAKTRGWQVIYVDLWGDKQADPFLLITEAIKSSMTQQKGKLAKLAQKVQAKMVILKTLELDFSKPGLPENTTLVDLLNDLAQLSTKPILLMIDEAQHAVMTQNGLNAMFALKSARDQMNIPLKTPRLMLVLTGSNRDKLAQLVIKKDQPFFGSEITAFPLLGEDYIDFFTTKVNQSLAANNQFTQEAIWEAFQLIGYRPEILRQIIGRVAINHDASALSDLLKHDTFIWRSQIWEEFANSFYQLPPLHQAILRALIEKGVMWSPFSEEAMRYYKQVLKESNLAISSVQTAIQSLREQGFIWQSSRGTYALEDESFVEWFKHIKNSTG